MIGAHLAKEKCWKDQIIQANKFNMRSFAIFLGAPQRWTLPKAFPDEINEENTIFNKENTIFNKENTIFNKENTIFNKENIIIHACLLINLVSSREDVVDKSIIRLTQELIQLKRYNLKYLVLHPGSSKEDDRYIKLAEKLNNILDNMDDPPTILLENMSGQGSMLLSDISDYAKILPLIHKQDCIGICLDTCHMYQAGYDISDKKVFEEIISMIDISKLKCFHINNSVKCCGACLDRHAPLKEGKIPLQFFVDLKADQRFVNLPFILETICEDVEVWQNL